MGLISRTAYVAGASVTAAGQNSNENAIVNEFNGNIENANIKSSAAIDASKLNLATVAQLIAMSSQPINFAKGGDIASATTTDIGAATGNVADVTGTTTITGLGTVQAGTIRFIQFDGALTLTHNATSLILPGGVNITTVAGDYAIFQSEGSGNWRCVVYQKSTEGRNNSVVEGRTGRSVLRAAHLLIEPGATPGTNINITADAVGGDNAPYNTPTITNATDLAKSGSSGSFALNAGGTAITMDITETIVALVSFSIVTHDLNNSSVLAGDIWFPRVTLTGGNMVISLYQTGTATGEDLTTILQAGDSCRLHIAFVTST